jgi:hypothetical protein
MIIATLIGLIFILIFCFIVYVKERNEQVTYLEKRVDTLRTEIVFSYNKGYMSAKSNKG